MPSPVPYLGLLDRVLSAVGPKVAPVIKKVAPAIKRVDPTSTAAGLLRTGNIQRSRQSTEEFLRSLGIKPPITKSGSTAIDKEIPMALGLFDKKAVSIPGLAGIGRLASRAGKFVGGLFNRAKPVEKSLLSAAEQAAAKAKMQGSLFTPKEVSESELPAMKKLTINTRDPEGAAARFADRNRATPSVGRRIAGTAALVGTGAGSETVYNNRDAIANRLYGNSSNTSETAPVSKEELAAAKAKTPPSAQPKGWFDRFGEGSNEAVGKLIPEYGPWAEKTQLGGMNIKQLLPYLLMGGGALGAYGLSKNLFGRDEEDSRPSNRW